MGASGWGRGMALPLAALISLLVCLGSAQPARAASPMTWSQPRTVDPPGTPTGWVDLECIGWSQCVGTTSQGAVATSSDATVGQSAWNVAAVGPHGVTHLSCPYYEVATGVATLCVGIDGSGDVLTWTAPSGGQATWTTLPIDPGHRMEAISCSAESFCVVVDDRGDAFTSTDLSSGATTWSGPVSIDPQPPGGLVDGIDCASGSQSSSLCVAVDSQGGVVSSTDPTGGSTAWHRVDVDGQNPIQDVSCSMSMCVAIGGNDTGQVLTSSNPAGDASAWVVGDIDGSNQLTALSCTGYICGAVDDRGNVLTTADPASGAASWSAPVSVDPGSSLTTISCQGDGFCMAGDAVGRIAKVNTNGTSSSLASLTWALAGPYALDQMSCPSSMLCVAIDDAYREVSSTDPAAGSDWSVTPIADFQEYQDGVLTLPLSCPSVSLCVSLPSWQAGPPSVFRNDLLLSTSSDPAAGGTTWSDSLLYSPTYAEVPALSCASSSLCAAAWESGILTSSDPTQTNSWTSANVGQAQAADVSCVSGPLCVAGTDDGQVVTSTDPTGTSVWQVAQVDGQSAIDSIWCSSESFCGAVDDNGNVLTSTDPAGGSAAWTIQHLNLDYQLSDLRCPSASLCVALGPDGDIVSSNDPTGPASSWTVTTIDPGVDLTSLSCPSPQLCVAGDADGNVIIGTAPPSPSTGSQGVAAPALGKRFTLTPLRGRVLVRLRGAKHFHRVTTATSFAFGVAVDTTRGRARITVAKRWSGTRSVQLWGGVARLYQNRSGMVTATLVGLLPGCRSLRSHLARARRLWTRAFGGVSTRGRYAAAIASGAMPTTWLTEDSCTSTLLRVRTGTITVLGGAHRKRLRVRARDSYLAR